MIDLATCDDNLAVAMAVTIGQKRSAKLSGISVGATGFPDAFFNSGVVTAPSPDLDAAVTFFDDLPFLIWARDGLDPGLEGAALRRGLALSNGPPLMVLEDLPPIPAPPDGVSIVEIGAGDLHETVTASAIGNGFGRHLAEVFANEELIGDGRVAIVLARIDSEAVATAAVVVTNDVAGIYAVSTVAEHRGKGLGAAVTWAAVEAGRDRGATWSLLQSSDLGLPVYRRMGYEFVGQYRFLTTPGS